MLALLFVLHDLDLWPFDLWPFDLKITGFSGLMAEHFYVMFGDPSYVVF